MAYSKTVNLNSKGWYLDTDPSTLLGKWTNCVDVVTVNTTGNYGIWVLSGTTVNTWGGNDKITGTNTGTNTSTNTGTNTGTFRAGIYNAGTINTGADDDIITGTSIDGTGIYNADTINTGCGNDVITGTSTFETGIVNFGTIDTGAGDDIITGISTGHIFKSGISISSGIINTGAGNDIITGTSNSNSSDSSGFENSISSINTGAGNDTIAGTSTVGTGINNTGSINTGAGDDIITGTSIDGTGIYNADIIDTGCGNDTIISDRSIVNAKTVVGSIDTSGNGRSPILTNLTGIILTGDGDDTIMGIDIAGIINEADCTINTSAGNDTIIGISSIANGIGIINGGTINTGAGDDIVDALFGGFRDMGTTYLENGADSLKGFGSGFFDGGNGEDRLLFGSGTYSVSNAENIDGFYTISNGITDMFVKNFELIGSASNPKAVFSFASVNGETFVVQLWILLENMACF